MWNGLTSKKMGFSTLSLRVTVLLAVLSTSTGLSFAYNSKEEVFCNAGYEAMQKGDLATAEEQFLKGEREAKGGDYGHCPNSLDYLAQLYGKKGNITKADEYYKKAIAVYSKEFGDGKQASHEMYSEYANLYLGKGETTKLATVVTIPKVKQTQSTAWTSKNDVARMDRAAEILNQASKSWNDEFKTEHPSSTSSVSLADRLCILARWCLKNDQPVKALSAATQAVKIGENMDAAKYYPLVRSEYFHVLAKAQIANKQFGSADQSIKKALSMRQDILGEKDLEIAELMNTKYDLLMAQGKSHEAKKLETSILGLWPRQSKVFESDRWLSLAKSANTKAENTGGSEDVEKSAADAVAMSRNFGEKDLRYAESLARQGINWLSHSHYEKCGPCIRRAVASLKLALGPMNGRTAEMLELWGSKLGRYDHVSSKDAIWVYNEALTIREKNLSTHKKDAFESAKLIAGYSRNLFSHHRNEEEQALLERATQLLVRSGGLANDTTCDALADLIQLTETPFGDQKKTKALYEQLLSGEKDLLGPDDPEVKRYARKYAALLRKIGQAVDAARVETQYRVK